MSTKNKIRFIGRTVKRATQLSVAFVCAIWFLVPVLTPIVTAATPSIIEYAIPGGVSPNDIIGGSDGALWFTESNQDQIGRITDGGNISEYNIASTANQLVNGSDGAIWFTLNTYPGTPKDVGRIATDGVATYYPAPANYTPYSIVAGPDGAIWYTAADNNNPSQYPPIVVRLAIDGTMTEFPADGFGGNGTGVNSMVAGPDGAIWSVGGGQASRMTTGGVVTIYNLPAETDANSITVGPDGNLWYANEGLDVGTDGPGASGVGMINTSGVSTDYYSPNPAGDTWGITTGSDGDIWFTEKFGDVGYVDLSGNFTELAVPTQNSQPLAITAGSDGNLWFTEVNAGQIGEVQLNTAPSAPTNLTVTSPTVKPSLSWDQSSGATSYNIYRDGSLIGTSTTTSYIDTTAIVGTHTYYVTAVTNGQESSESNTISVVVGTVPTITSNNSASTGMNVPFSFAVTTTGNPSPTITESGSLPEGITFTDNGNGTASIGGAASIGTTGTYPITITATNSVGSTTQNFDLSITTAASAPTITNTNSVTVEYGVAMTSFSITATGYPVPYLSESGLLPSGLTFTNNHNGTATISGTPRGGASGVYTVTITARNSAGTTTQSFTITVNKASTITSADTSVAVPLIPFYFRVTTNGYPAPTYTLTGTLPSGLSFNTSTGVISGTPSLSSVGFHNLTITATNSAGTASQSFELTVL